MFNGFPSNPLGISDTTALSRLAGHLPVASTALKSTARRSKRGVHRSHRKGSKKYASEPEAEVDGLHEKQADALSDYFELSDENAPCGTGHVIPSI